MNTFLNTASSFLNASNTIKNLSDRFHILIQSAFDDKFSIHHVEKQKLLTVLRYFRKIKKKYFTCFLFIEFFSKWNNWIFFPKCFLCSSSAPGRNTGLLLFCAFWHIEYTWTTWNYDISPQMFVATKRMWPHHTFVVDWAITICFPFCSSDAQQLKLSTQTISNSINRLLQTAKMSSIKIQVCSFRLHVYV